MRKTLAGLSEVPGILMRLMEILVPLAYGLVKTSRHLISQQIYSAETKFVDCACIMIA